MDAAKPARLSEHRSSERREAIYDFVAAHSVHPTAEEILSAVRKRIPGLGLATVYRNLEILVNEGRLTRTIHDGVARFDADMKPHHHFSCDRCGAVANIELEIPRQLIRAAGARARARVQEARIEFRGLCRDCARKE